jgi:hypothetical protein
MQRQFQQDGINNYAEGCLPTVRQKVKSWIPDWFVSIRDHAKAHGAFPRMIRATSFNDKVLRRIIFDRRPLWTQLADKAAARSYVQERLGAQILPKLYHLTTDPKTIPFESLPTKFVIKPTHGSGWVQIVTDKSSLDSTALIQECSEWPGQSFYRRTREWAYKNIKPQIIVEEFIDDGTGGAPNGYKLFTFDGAVRMIQVDMKRFTGHRRRLYSPAWEKLDARFVYDDFDGDLEPPPNLHRMIVAAEKLGRGLDFIRADFYDTTDRIYFGEFATTPECGKGRFTPTELDYELGEHWKRQSR